VIKNTVLSSHLNQKENGIEEVKKVIPSASCLIFNEADELLLMRRTIHDVGGGLWGLPAGRIDPGEDAKTTVLREIKEETNIDLGDVKFLGVHKITMPHAIVPMSTFEARVSQGIAITLNPNEHDAYDWFTLPTLLTVKNIIWGLPTTLKDYGLMDGFEVDPTLNDGSSLERIE